MIQWTDSLATGHPVVDNDHKQLISTLNELEIALQKGTAKEQITQMITFLNQYAREHFGREEAHMARVNCPSLHENCKAHKEFTVKLDGWVARLKQQGTNTSLVLEVFRETSGWIRAHILRIDCQLRGCKA